MFKDLPEGQTHSYYDSCGHIPIKVLKGSDAFFRNEIQMLDIIQYSHYKFYGEIIDGISRRKILSEIREVGVEI